MTIDPALLLLRKKLHKHGGLFPVTRRQAAMLESAGYAKVVFMNARSTSMTATPLGLQMDRPTDSELAVSVSRRKRVKR